MDWAYYWLLMGILAFGFVIANLIRAALGKRRGWQVLLFASLSCGALTMLCMVQMVNNWVQKEDWSALLDCVPAMASWLTIALCLGILLNLLALCLHLRGEVKT
ncbi:MAG: hypothetical protein HFF76_09965 [Oscillospiraceae bacterium]|jgi:uncharacterized membrane protein YidH (DUF202 family)|nr:hypothetical protein [Oscillospiraceae bacterium]